MMKKYKDLVELLKDQFKGEWVDKYLIDVANGVETQLTSQGDGWVEFEHKSKKIKIYEKTNIASPDRKDFNNEDEFDDAYDEWINELEYYYTCES